MVENASGEINRKHFKTPVEFRALLKDRQDDFRRALVRKLLSYALGRGVQNSDRATIESICVAVKADGDRFSSIVVNVARSYTFQHARGMKGQSAEDTSKTTRFYPVASAELPATATVAVQGNK